MVGLEEGWGWGWGLDDEYGDARMVPLLFGGVLLGLEDCVSFGWGGPMERRG